MYSAGKTAAVSISLVEKIQEGDQLAFEHLINIMKRPLFQKVYSIIHDYDEAMDIIQETFMRFYLNLHKLKSKARIRYYILKIAINRALSRKRMLINKTVSLSDDDCAIDSILYEAANMCDNPEKETERMEFRVILMSALESLPPQQRICFVLNDLDGLSKRQISESMGCSEATVRSNLHNARSRLRRELKGKYSAKRFLLN